MAEENLKVDLKTLDIATFNIRGLRNKNKLNAVIDCLKKTRIKIIALQETHLLEKDYEYLEQIWDGPIIFSEGSNYSKGICILFDKYFNDKITHIFSDDRILLCSFKVGEEIFYLCNIYAPNENNDKKYFFNSLQNTIRKHVNDQQIMKTLFLGDFNCVGNNKMDIISGEPHSQEVVLCFNNMASNLEINDIWRLHNPNAKEYTWSRNNPMIARRLDYIFAGNFLIPFLTNCIIKSMPHSDHRLVYCSLEFFKFKRGNGTYKINSSLFENSIFKDNMSKLINENIENLIDVDPIIKWNIVKAKIKELAQQFGKFNKINKDNEINALSDKLQLLETELANDIDNDGKQKDVLDIKSRLELLNFEKTEAAKIRSKLQWIEEGEKCTKFF